MPNFRVYKVIINMDGHVRQQNVREENVGDVDVPWKGRNSIYGAEEIVMHDGQTTILKVIAGTAFIET